VNETEQHSSLNLINYIISKGLVICNTDEKKQFDAYFFVRICDKIAQKLELLWHLYRSVISGSKN